MLKNTSVLSLLDKPMMAKKAARPLAGKSGEQFFSDGDGNPIYNEILQSLPPNEAAYIFPKLEFMRLNVHHVLHEAGDSLKSVYFCNEGMISILSIFPDGKSVEVGLVGKEGFVGLPLVAGFKSAFNRAIVQIQATVFRMTAESLADSLRQCAQFELKLRQFSLVMGMEATQIAACNRLHEVEERLARWLLMCSKRVGTMSLPLTQELLAQMLGTRRSSVTVAAGILQRAGLIRYSRGIVNIVSLDRLEQSACECYDLMQQQEHRWRSERPS